MFTHYAKWLKSGKVVSSLNIYVQSQQLSPIHKSFGFKAKFKFKSVTQDRTTDSDRRALIIVCMVITYSIVWIDRVRLPILLVVSFTGKNDISLSPFAPENLVSRDGFGSPVSCQPAHLHTQAESGAYLRDSSRFPRGRPFIYLNHHAPSFIYFKPPYAIGSIPSLSGHAIAYRWRSLPRVRRHRASKPQDSSKRVLPWQVTMDQIICASLSDTHCWYEVAIAC